ncbi:unnamed protein product [Heligmosomoides polygyrus]|uniref:Uncharacterized protein n=1 Tax=Heligmosomoides polygyrus TaxID=6339 RepID=A0A183FB50_HELPZ|nr:unnamed protein product [Heligmosomoides polygyrus]
MPSFKLKHSLNMPSPEQPAPSPASKKKKSPSPASSDIPAAAPIKRRKQDFASDDSHVTEESLTAKLDNFSKKIVEQLEDVKTVVTIHTDEIEQEVRSL